MTKLQTIKGHTFDLINTAPAMIDPDEICRVLSRIPRFGGHTIETYLVAQHSLLVESLVDDPALKLPALLHDAHEVYSGFGDVQHPAKILIPSDSLWELEYRIDCAVASHFGFDVDLMHSFAVKEADLIARATERRDMMAKADDPSIWGTLPEPATERIVAMSSREAEGAFRYRLYELWGETCH